MWHTKSLFGGSLLMFITVLAVGVAAERENVDAVVHILCAERTISQTTVS